MNENVLYAPLHLFPFFQNMSQRRKRACKVKQMDETRGGGGRGRGNAFSRILAINEMCIVFSKKKKIR